MPPILAEAPSVTDIFASWVPWASMGVNGVVSGLLIWIITYGIPEMRRQEHRSLADVVSGFRQSLANVFDGFREEREADRNSRHESNQAFNEIVAKLFDGSKEEINGLAKAVTELRISNERICKHPGMMPNGKS